MPDALSVVLQSVHWPSVRLKVVVDNVPLLVERVSVLLLFLSKGAALNLMVTGVLASTLNEGLVAS